ncbi:golgin subfamily A member 6-like protein 22 [Dendronephthya gigantea]|uniref:golgin subfamily A member 6-like protein 22 n=1 Tax=Dendronephthya gigantea TaxID=151771 RepID=UPI00106AAF45|nr:golgin subfamily A member 6-like protein 22 [Dendronephthya gigantea]
MSTASVRTPDGSQFNIDDLNQGDLKRIIAVQQRDIKVKNERLDGLEKLTILYNISEEKRHSWKTMAENLEIALRRAEARIAVLNKKLNIGPQTAFDISVVNPGISRKDFDAITKENIALKEALEHIVPTELGGKDVVLKNQELYEFVTKQQEEIIEKDNHIRELETALAGNDNELALKVNDQTKKIMKMERSMNAKQVFSEKLMKENKNLTNLLEKIRNQELRKQHDVPDGQASGNEMNAQIAKKATDVVNEEQERMLKEFEAKEKRILELEQKIQELTADNENKSKQVLELTNALQQANDVKAKLESELSESVKKCSDFQTKCNGFFKQVLSLNRKQQDSEEEISELKQAIENFRAQVAEKEAMMVMMRDSLKTYESDFRSENEEKEKILKQLNESKQECERLRRENQSHMATVRHFESEIERMNKLLNEKNKSNSNIGLPFGQPFGSSVPTRSFFHDRNPAQMVVADGVGGVNESTGGTRQTNTSINPPKASPTLIECPYCSRSYPYHLIEGHVQDCMEDSLYMDD